MLHLQSTSVETETSVGNKSFFLGDVATLVWSHMNGLQPFEYTIEQTTETMGP